MADKNNTSKKVSARGKNRENGAQTENADVKPENAITDAFKGIYRTSTALNVREQAKSDARILGVLNTGTLVSCGGRYAIHNGIRYLYITSQSDASLEGYCQVQFLIKQ